MRGSLFGVGGGMLGVVVAAELLPGRGPIVSIQQEANGIVVVAFSFDPL